MIKLINILKEELSYSTEQTINKVIKGFDLVKAPSGFGGNLRFITKNGHATPELAKQINKFIQTKLKDFNVIFVFEKTYRTLNVFTRNELNELKIKSSLNPIAYINVFSTISYMIFPTYIPGFPYPDAWEYNEERNEFSIILTEEEDELIFVEKFLKEHDFIYKVKNNINDYKLIISAKYFTLIDDLIPMENITSRDIGDFEYN